MSEQEIADHRDELELFAEHAERMAETIGARSDTGYAIAKIAHGLEMLLRPGPGD